MAHSIHVILYGMNTETSLCPFSKPIIGNWCQCPHARLADRCSGKMICSREAEYLDSCIALVDILKENSRFVLGLGKDDVKLIHAQLMKIRCGGLLWMQRVLALPVDEPPAVRDVIDKTNSAYGEVTRFPFNEIVQDIRFFTHRKTRRNQS